jgi:hypothetical protein
VIDGRGTLAAAPLDDLRRFTLKVNSRVALGNAERRD